MEARNKLKLERNREISTRRKHSINNSNFEIRNLDSNKADLTQRHFTLLFSSLNEAQLSEIVQAFNLNPILLWDIMLK